MLFGRGMYYTYIIRSISNLKKTYIGFTADINERLKSLESDLRRKISL
ncbi:MAG: GIY-YIG nuclease family protein [Candidatus Cloacimonetes bacterium]|nr:GIY-YIG nuclease family protein [Candidatus Cloacimonadota bacterium]MCF7815388.1 GIY-YIG nuclease family protein [Candidatus Cloacimonadota bacterium]MCF7869480.1 GIY-YIG nuclease family protein [Candidatus Cloacimonadota bacterium]MCF7883148.1 GIY-YIG nuclease family protein [Candidatus Cloacimonadota bacterium]